MSAAARKPRVTLADVRRDHDEVDLRIETIDPQRAYEILERNTNNRALRDREVAKYARDMKEGRWRRGAGEPIHIAPDGEVGNGQHRLYAVIEGGVAVDLPVLYAPIEYRAVADQGIKRRFSDVLRIEYQEENVFVYAAAVRVLWEFSQSSLIGSKADPPSTSEMINVYLTVPDLKNSVSRSRTNTSVKVRPGLAVALHYLFSQVDRADADRFFDRLADGVGLQERDPILAARKWFFGSSKTDSIRDQAAIVIRAWNNMRLGHRVGYYKKTDEFPKIQGLR